jgi:hypothetical protein
MSYWQENNIEEKITQIIASVHVHDPSHHFGLPFLTAYQIAIEFADRYPDDAAGLGFPVGGSGIGQRNSLAQYLAKELSRGINTGRITHIEGGFLSNHKLNAITFDNNGEIITSSLTISIFRLRNS